MYHELLPAHTQEANVAKPNLVEYECELYPVTDVAARLGLTELKNLQDKNSLEIIYSSDWMPVSIQKDSPLGNILNYLPVHSLKFKRQLGPNAKYPYPYTHTIWEHSAEQVIVNVLTISRLAEENEELFLEAAQRYRFEEVDSRKQVQNLCLAGALIGALHDAESPALRDTMKFALKDENVDTDENSLLAKRLRDPKDKKYFSLFESLIDSGQITPEFGRNLPEIIAHVVLRKEEGLLGDLTHAAPRPDKTDPNASSRPFDMDRIVYTMQDLIRVFGDITFDPEAKDAESALGVNFLQQNLLFRVENLHHLKWLLSNAETEEIGNHFRKTYFPGKIRPSYFDITPDITLARDESGIARLAFKDKHKLYDFLMPGFAENLSGMYLTPGLIYTEKQLEAAFKEGKNHLKEALGIPSDQELVDFFLDLSDYEALIILRETVPQTADAISDSSYKNYYYHSIMLDRAEALRESKRENCVAVPIHIHSGTSTRIIDERGVAMPFCEAEPRSAQEIQGHLNGWLRGKYLVITRVDNKNNPFIPYLNPQPDEGEVTIHI